MAELTFAAQAPSFKRPALLRHGNIPKPLHELTPRTIRGTEWWDAERRAAYAANNYCCWACGVHKSQAKYYQHLEAHEMYRIDWKKGRSVYKGACALCHSCHNYIHSGRLKILVHQKSISQYKYDDVMRHGQRITGKKNKPPMPREVQQDWSRWHLVLEGERYFSKFASLREWEKHFERR